MTDPTQNELVEIGDLDLDQWNDYAIEQGLLEGPEDFYDRKHVNSDLFTVNFTQHSLEECYQLLYEANKRLVNDYISHQKQSYMEQIRQLYIEKDTSFRGFRHT